MKEQIDKIRNELYEALPTGKVNTFEFMKVINNHICKLDTLSSQFSLNKEKNENQLYKNNITTNELLSLMKITESLMENETNQTELQILNERIYKIKQMINKQYNEIINEINIK